jgi:hypothetical protein
MTHKVDPEVHFKVKGHNRWSSRSGGRAFVVGELGVVPGGMAVPDLTGMFPTILVVG